MKFDEPYLASILRALFLAIDTAAQQRQLRTTEKREGKRKKKGKGKRKKLGAEEAEKVAPVRFSNPP